MKELAYYKTECICDQFDIVARVLNEHKSRHLGRRFILVDMNSLKFRTSEWNNETAFCMESTGWMCCSVEKKLFICHIWYSNADVNIWGWRFKEKFINRFTNWSMRHLWHIELKGLLFFIIIKSVSSYLREEIILNSPASLYYLEVQCRDTMKISQQLTVGRDVIAAVRHIFEVILPDDADPQRTRLALEVPAHHPEGGDALLSSLRGSLRGHGRAYCGDLPCLNRATSFPHSGERRQCLTSRAV